MSFSPLLEIAKLKSNQIFSERVPRELELQTLFLAPKSSFFDEISADFQNASADPGILSRGAGP
jgi:hypothetical protein